MVLPTRPEITKTLPCQMRRNSDSYSYCMRRLPSTRIRTTSGTYTVSPLWHAKTEAVKHVYILTVSIQASPFERDTFFYPKMCLWVYWKYFCTTCGTEILCQWSHVQRLCPEGQRRGEACPVQVKGTQIPSPATCRACMLRMTQGRQVNCTTGLLLPGKCERAQARTLGEKRVWFRSFLNHSSHSFLPSCDLKERHAVRSLILYEFERCILLLYTRYLMPVVHRVRWQINECTLQ